MRQGPILPEREIISESVPDGNDHGTRNHQYAEDHKRLLLYLRT